MGFFDNKRDTPEPREPRQAPAPAPVPAPAPDPNAPPDIVPDPVEWTGDFPPASDPNQDANVMPNDLIGDIPPPPIPPPPTIQGPGVGGIPGTEAGTLSRPGAAGAVPFRTAAYRSPRSPRFGPGVPLVGGASMNVGDEGLGLQPDEAAELLARLARLAAGRG
jgi:hypothetical protein